MIIMKMIDSCLWIKYFTTKSIIHSFILSYGCAHQIDDYSARRVDNVKPNDKYNYLYLHL